MPPPSSWTTTQVAESFAAHPALRKYADEVRSLEIEGSDLVALDEQSVKEMFGLGSQLVVKKVTAAIRTLVKSSAPNEESSNVSKAEAKAEGPSTSGKIQLPKGKR